MSIDLYFAGGCASRIEDFLLAHNGNRLFTQKYERNTTGKLWIGYADNHPDFTGKLFVDSSAYSAWTRNVDIDLDDYIGYLNENDGCFSVIASLDVIPASKGEFATRQQVIDASEQSWDNYLYMYDKVWDKDKVIPVFHIGEPWSYLDKILAYRHPDGSKVQYIGLGGLVGTHRNDRMKFMSQVFERIKKSSNPEIKVHGFGVTDLLLLTQFPFTSADSTSAIITGAMGNIMTPYGIVSFARKHGGAETFYQLGKPIQDSILQLIEESGLGFTIEELAENYIARELINCQYLLDWAKSYKYTPLKHKQNRLF